ncbi:MAG TPA: hypothetical protein VGM83_05470 [Devosiaceae bacterium]
MSDHTDTHAQADFLGGLSMALLALCILFPLFVLLSVMTHG